jgi:hypothetical protein
LNSEKTSISDLIKDGLQNIPPTVQPLDPADSPRELCYNIDEVDSGMKYIQNGLKQGATSPFLSNFGLGKSKKLNRDLN